MLVTMANQRSEGRTGGQVGVCVPGEDGVGLFVCIVEKTAKERSF